MLEIGKINRLKIVSHVGPEIYLSGPGAAKILLTGKKPPSGCDIGDVLEVFVYADSDGHLAATVTAPKAVADDIAWLRVVSVNRTGAFLDWGLPKDLLVPRIEQHQELEAGKFYLVKLYLDSQNRILGTTKIDRYLTDEGPYFKTGQAVSLLIADRTSLGVKAVVNNTHWGMLYENEIFQAIQQGQKLEGFIKHIRPDFRLDLSLYRPGYGKVAAIEDKILEQLNAKDGFLPLSDKSPPETIYAALGVSKKVYKQAIGALYKKKRVLIETGGIRLI